jgi:hypothetical protein
MMRGLVLALALGAALPVQAAQISQEPGKPDALSHFENQLDHFVGSWAVTQQRLAAQAQTGRKGTTFLTPEQSRKFFSKLKSIPAAPAEEPPKERITLKPGQPCAIPLLNVLGRENVDPKMILPNRLKEGDGKIKIFAPPAPSCDDVK